MRAVYGNFKPPRRQVQRAPLPAEIARLADQTLEAYEAYVDRCAGRARDVGRERIELCVPRGGGPGAGGSARLFIAARARLFLVAQGRGGHRRSFLWRPACQEKRYHAPPGACPVVAASAAEN